jgi:mRNA interferase RelE/StbE
MKTQIVFSKKAKKDLEKLDHSVRDRVDRAIQDKLLKNPDAHLIPLTGRFDGCYKMRVGDYRLVCKKEKNGNFIILVVTIQHRREVYSLF